MYETREKDGFRFIDEGPNGQTAVVLLHGMLGGPENWHAATKILIAHGYRTIVPELPVYRLPMEETSVAGLAQHTASFLEWLGIERPVLVGNSLGGHIALVHTLNHGDSVSGLVLTGASGIQEAILGDSQLKRFDRDYVRRKAALTFYDPAHVTDELVDQVARIVCDRASAVRLIRMAKSAKKDTVEERLDEIEVPSLLIWGRQDRLTPPEIARDFQSRLGSASLEFIDECGHAPMIEQPGRFSMHLLRFLERLASFRERRYDLQSRRAIG